MSQRELNRMEITNTQLIAILNNLPLIQPAWHCPQGQVCATVMPQGYKSYKGYKFYSASNQPLQPNKYGAFTYYTYNNYSTESDFLKDLGINSEVSENIVNGIPNLYLGIGIVAGFIWFTRK